MSPTAALVAAGQRLFERFGHPNASIHVVSQALGKGMKLAVGLGNPVAAPYLPFESDARREERERWIEKRIEGMRRAAYRRKGTLGELIEERADGTIVFSPACRRPEPPCCCRRRRGPHRHCEKMGCTALAIRPEAVDPYFPEDMQAGFREPKVWHCASHAYVSKFCVGVLGQVCANVVTGVHVARHLVRCAKCKSLAEEIGRAGRPPFRPSNLP